MRTRMTKERLRAAALDLFAEKGFRETTVGEIEAAAGLAPRAGSFYRHYSSKDEIFTDCIDTFIEEANPELSFSELLPLGDVRAELLVIGRTLLTIGKKHRKARTVLRKEGRRHPRFSSKIGRINRRFTEQSLAPWLRATIGESDANPERLRSLAHLIFGPVLYYMMQQDVEQKAFGLGEEAMLTAWADFWATQLQERDRALLAGD